MNIYDSLRAVLQQKAETAANTAGLAGKIDLGNEQFTPPKKDTYVTFWFRTGGSRQEELGPNTSLEMTVGIYQFDILVPEYEGDGPGTRIADVIRKAFNRKQWDVAPDGYVNTMLASVKTPFSKPQGGYYRIIVDGSFHYFHRDPDAPDFRS